MEPRQHELSGGLERAPVTVPGYEVQSTGERGQESTHEVAGKPLPEVGAVQAEAAQIAMPALPTPVITQDDNGQTAADDTVLLSAGDDDLIEKEWVDKAKKILAETRDDPYRREREVSKLQIEYIRRRYGREIGESGD